MRLIAATMLLTACAGAYVAGDIGARSTSSDKNSPR